MASDTSLPKTGWYARLQGNEVDLDDWRHSLKEPFDPVAERLPNGETVLRSTDFDGLASASEVRERALVIIARLNGALSLWNGARPVTFGGVYRISEDGKQPSWVFGEAALEGRSVMRATAIALGPDGKPIPPPPPSASQLQGWNGLADQNDYVSDLFDYYGRANNWYDIYKTIEIAEKLARGEHKLLKLLGADAKTGKRLKRSANYYRHTKFPRPPDLLTLQEAKPLLANLVRTVLSTLCR